MSDVNRSPSKKYLDWMDYIQRNVRDIAKEVGVRESALYKHFKSKQEILDKIAEKLLFITL